MRRLAESFIEDTAAEGQVFAWDSADAGRLDDLCDELAASRPSKARRHAWVMGVGAYLGELMVRNGGGHWSYDVKEEAAVVEMPNGLRGYPHNKVFKRLTIGPQHNLFQFYWYALTRDVPPGSMITERPW